MHIDVLTLFPEMFTGPLSCSILGRACEQGLFSYRLWNIRDWACDRHRTVDDSPYGGGAGMVMKPDIVAAAIEAVKAKGSDYVIHLTPQGPTFDQRAASRLAEMKGFMLVCSHYEGVDQRVVDLLVDEELSIGDYVLTGGELPAMVVMDSVVRLLPGVLGKAESAETDSFYHGLLQHPQYTRPPVFRGHAVPDILRSGNHEAIRCWRLKESVRKTWQVRPDLLRRRRLSTEERQALDEVQRQEGERR